MTLKVVYVLSKLYPTEDKEVDVAEKWKEDNYLCHSHILNVLSNSLFDIYVNIATIKEIWEALTHKYKTVDVGNKKFLINNYIDFKMTDDRPTIDQVHELQVIADLITPQGIKVNKIF